METDHNEDNQERKVADALKKIFGFSAFRDYQERIINAVLRGEDVFAAMPTGGGKSLCYQLPSYIMRGTCVVISPLIALMKDQVDAARHIGIRAEYINSTLSGPEIAEINTRLVDGEVDLLYVAPERFAMERFIKTLQSFPVSFFAIDEAHCISEWGHDFRPDYLSLSLIIRCFPGVPIAAFTATATEQVQHDIITKLSLRDPFIVRASFNRPNLFYNVIEKEDTLHQILECIKEHKDESGIVYRTTRRSVEETSTFLVEHGIQALPYHAGLDSAMRTKYQEAFSRDRVQIMVATIAFGMGIDKSNIRFIVHGDLPKSIEGYYQETGRAGRDGEDAECVLLFGRGDAAKIRYFINQVTDPHERQTASKKLQEMILFASSHQCRRQQLLAYFNEQFLEENCEKCDICMGTLEEIDATIDAQILMSAIVRTGQRFGIGHIIDIVVGANTKKIRELQHDQIKTHGVGKSKPKKFWRFLADQMLAQEYLVSTNEQHPHLLLTKKGTRVLSGLEVLTIVRKKQERKQVQQTASIPHKHNSELSSLLRGLRKDIADEENVPPFIIFSDKTLYEMSGKIPTTEAALLTITGIGERKLSMYGKRILELLQGYAKEHPELVQELPGTTVLLPQSRTKGKRSATREETWGLLRDGLSYREIARKRGVTPSTVVTHIEHLVQDGRPYTIEQHLEHDKRVKIEALFTSCNTRLLKPVVEASGHTITYEEARLVRIALEQP